MALANPNTFRDMVDSAKAGGYALPAYNVSSLEMLTGVLEGLSDADSDGIVSVSVNASRFVSGTRVADAVLGAVTFAEFTARVADRYPVTVALHTDHCGPADLLVFVEPLLQISERRVAAGDPPLYHAHMWDGSSLPLAENLAVATSLHDRCRAAEVLLELEVGVVGGEREGSTAEYPAHLYTTPDDLLAVAEALGTGERGRYLLAATFGNVHGVYKPGNVKLRPEILKAAQEAVATEGNDRPFDLVFHGGSGSSEQEISDAVDYGVVKMNIDTDTQYAFTRAVVGHVLSNYDGVLKIDGEVGSKKAYDPRSWGKAAETAMAERVTSACRHLRSAGTSVTA